MFHQSSQSFMRSFTSIHQAQSDASRSFHAFAEDMAGFRNFGAWIGRWPCNITYCTDKWKIHHETSCEISFQCGMSDIAQNKNHDECRRCREWFPCELGLFGVVSRAHWTRKPFTLCEALVATIDIVVREKLQLFRFTCHCVRRVIYHIRVFVTVGVRTPKRFGQRRYKTQNSLTTCISSVANLLWTHNQ